MLPQRLFSLICQMNRWAALGLPSLDLQPPLPLRTQTPSLTSPASSFSRMSCQQTLEPVVRLSLVSSQQE